MNKSTCICIHPFQEKTKSCFSLYLGLTLLLALGVHPLPSSLRVIRSIIPSLSRIINLPHSKLSFLFSFGLSLTNYFLCLDLIPLASDHDTHLLTWHSTWISQRHLSQSLVLIPAFSCIEWNYCPSSCTSHRTESPFSLPPLTSIGTHYQVLTVASWICLITWLCMSTTTTCPELQQ